MDFKKWISALGFTPKEHTVNTYSKRYPLHKGYHIDVDFDKEEICYNEIVSDSKTTQNFSQPENFVVLDCVDRLLTKGYKPTDITLEKTYPSGHGHSGRLDILVKKNKRAFLMIECKTWGAEFDKEYKLIQKNGGQLFTYFQNDTNADYLMLYASHITSEGTKCRCEIVKIEDNYRTAGNVEDTFARWSKLTYTNGIFEDWVNAYEYQNKLLTKKDLVPLTEADSGTIFHGFLSILRKHSVSDKPNAFNKIFNLFLAKIYDEKKREDDELDFQWKEREDDPVEFQIRLINLHKEGLFEFLRKEIVGISDDDFESKTAEDLYKQKKERLKFNKIFDIKDVIDDESFDDNFRVLKEVVQLLEKYQIRYPRKQQHLSDFFERLLTTGLKQEAGQYFTPPPITKYIVRSLPIKAMIENEVNQKVAKLPAVIDYAAGSGHFVTEIMEAYQDTINKLESSGYYPDAQNEVAAWQINPYSWAAKYVYGIEKDYRLVKVAKVGCYFYGDGLARIIHGDGLDSFAKSKSYVELLKDNSTKSQFSIVVSNPPYSVDAFKGDLRNIDAGKDFSLYGSLTDKSKEIECLFVERTAQLLKEGGVAGIVLPSSILSNGGIYTKTREIILQNFEIVAITELGSNTFMATGTNTVVLFLRRRNNNDAKNIREAVDRYFNTCNEVTIKGIEKPVTKYIAHVWKGLDYADYVTLLQKLPNEKVKAHEIYTEYRKKIKAKDETGFWQDVLALESEKLTYFIIAYPQKIVLVKSGEKDTEKRFLGYEFSERRGSEGIHPIQRGKNIDECTQLFDAYTYDNPDKASTYIYKAFKGDFESEIADSMQNNVSRVRLVDMLTFDRVDFEKIISTAIKKKVRFDDLWKSENLVSLGEIAEIKKGTSITKEKTVKGNIPVIAGGQDIAYFHNASNREGNIITISASGAYSGFVNYYSEPIFASDCNTVNSKDETKITTKLIFHFLKSIQQELYDLQRGQAQPHVYGEDIAKIKIPLPPFNVQQKIIAEIEALEKAEVEANKKITRTKEQIENTCLLCYQKYDKEKLSQLVATNPSKTEIANLDSDTLVSFVDMPSVSNDGDIVHKADRPYSELKRGSYTYFRDGDIIIAKITPCMENGKCALATGLTNGLALGSSEFHVFRANNDRINTKYLFTLLNRKSVRVEAEKNMTGASGHRRVPIAFYESLEIPVPSLSEQQKIVAEIETLEKEMAKAQEVIDKSPAQKAEIIHKYLQSTNKL